MPSSSLDQDGDLEAQQGVLHMANKPPRFYWRVIFLFLRARQMLFSATVKVQNGSPSLAKNSSSVISSNEREDMGPRPIAIVVASDHEDHEKGSSHAKIQYASIAKIVKEKDFQSLHEFGGIQGIADALDSDINNGIPAGNTITKALQKAYIRFLPKSSRSWIVFLLLVNTILSLVSVIMQKGRNGWLEGAIILATMLILVFAPALRDYRKRKLPKNGRTVVEVIRGARHQQILASNVLLGDVVCLERGNLLPADGVLISGELLVLNDGSQGTVNDQNPFLLYGSKVVNGSGRMLVTFVGENTVREEITSNADESKMKWLQAQLGNLITDSEVMGLVVSILITAIMILNLLLKKEIQNLQLPDSKGKPKMIEEIMDSIKRVSVQPTGKITSFAMYLIGAVEGFPFFLALAINYWNKKALCGRAYTKQPYACVSMGSVTTIVTDKTSGLTLEKLEVDTFYMGGEIISQATRIETHVLEALCNGISMPILQGPSTYMDSFLLSWATWNLGLKMENLEQISCIGVMVVGKNPDEEGHGVLTRRNEGDGSMSLQWRGHPTTILAMCSCYYDSKGAIHDMDAQKRNKFQKIIKEMQLKNLKIIAFAYSKIDAPVLEEKNLILLGMMGLKELCLQGIKDAMEVYKKAGVNIKLVSGDDNLSALEKIARQNGLLRPNSDAIVIHGETFRAWTDEERKDKVDKIAVMGNTLPSDRLLLIKCLKEKEKVVAVVGATKNDVPALKEADVGIAMGNWSSKMARESSDIFVWDGDFMLLATLISYGRCAYENIRKYTQLVLTMLAAWLSVSFIMAESTENSKITTVQFLWINFSMTALGGLALLTQPATEKPMQNSPTGRTKRLVTNAMWRNIVIQASYQTATQVTFCSKGQALLGIDEKVSKTIAFYSLALSHVFNILSAREPEMKNVFKGIHRHVYFSVAVVLAVGLQEVFMLLAHIVAGDAILKWEHRAVCFLIGALCMVVDLMTKCISGLIRNILIGWPFIWHMGTCTSMASSAVSEFASVVELQEIISDNNILDSTSTLEVPAINDNPSESIDSLDLPPVGSTATAIPT